MSHVVDPTRRPPGYRQVDELAITIAPATLGAGKRLFDGFGESPLKPVQLGVRQSHYRR
jgi:dihydrofolate reductase